MENFLSLQLPPNDSVPPLMSIIESITDDLNSVFYSLGNWVYSCKDLNFTYSLVSIRDIINSKPIEKDIKPTQSFKWLFLIHSLASKVLSDNEAIDNAKNEFVLNYFFELIKNTKFDTPYSLEFLIGLITITARFIISAKNIKEEHITADLYQRLIEIFNSEITPGESIPTSEFSSTDLLAFCLPIQADIQPKNSFSNPHYLLKASIIRLLIRIVPLKFPTENEQELIEIVAKLSHSGPAANAAIIALKTLFHGDEIAAYRYKDNLTYSTISECIKKFNDKTDGFRKFLPYQENISLAQSLINVEATASEHAAVWASYLSENPELTLALEHLLTSEYDSSFIITSATLMRLGSAQFTDPAIPIKLFIASSNTKLRKELQELLLGQPDEVCNLIVKELPMVCNYGSRSDVFFDFLGQLLLKVSEPNNLIASLLESIRTEHQTICGHPNAHLYERLQSFIELSASYLDEEPCMVCNNPDIRPRGLPLDEWPGTKKYTDSSIMRMFQQPVVISEVTLSFSFRKKEQSPKLVRILASSVELNSANEMLSEKPAWRLLGEIALSKGQTSANFKLPLQSFATCIKISFDEMYTESSETQIRCPSCHQPIQDPRSGICSRCRENAYQCKKCRSINYNNLMGFICPDCGSSNYCDIHVRITATESFSNTRIASSKDVEAALKKADSLMGEAHEIFTRIAALKQRIDFQLSPANTASVTSVINELQSLYNKECRAQYQRLTVVVQHATAIRKGIAEFLDIARSSNSEDAGANMCHNCRQTFINNALRFLTKIAEVQEIDTGDAARLLISFLDKPSFSKAAVSSLVAICKIRPDLTEKVVDMFIQGLNDPSPQLVLLLCDVLKIDDTHMESRFFSIGRAVEEATKLIPNSAAIIQTVIEPLVLAMTNSPLIGFSTVAQSADPEYELESSDSESDEPPNLYTYGRLASRQKQKQNKPKPLPVKKEESEREPKINVLKIFSRTTLETLLISKSLTIRTTLGKLITIATKQSQENYNSVLNLLFELTKDGSYVDRGFDKVTNALAYFLKSPEMRETGMKILSNVLNGIEGQVKNTLAGEGSLKIDLTVGQPLSFLCNILNAILTSPTSLIELIQKRPEDCALIVKSFFQLKSLVIQRSKYLDDSIEIIKEIVGQILAPELKVSETEMWQNTLGQEIVLRAAVASLPISRDRVIIELTRLIFPPVNHLSVPIVMKKVRSQEDYIPGRVSPEPIMSEKIGLLMRDIKTKICTDLNMTHLIDDDRGMELLVDNCIIGLDLLIEDVYKRVWEVHNPGSPMVVIFRLQGLDGEATEPFITSFPSEEGQEVDNKVKFAYSRCLGQSFGELFSGFNSADLSVVESLCQLLHAFAALPENREAMCACGGVRILFETMGRIIDGADAELFMKVMELAQILVKTDVGEKPDEGIAFVFQALTTNLVRNNESLLAPLLGLLQPLSSKSDELMHNVLDFFVDGLKPQKTVESFNFFKDYAALYMMRGFSEFVFALPINSNLRAKIDEQPLVNDAIEFLLEKFPAAEGPRDNSWTAAAEISVMPSLLKVLAGMVLGHTPTQEKLLASDGLPLLTLMKLKGIASKDNIGELAQTVLENAKVEPSICAEFIERERKREIARAKKLAMQKRQEMMNMMMSNSFEKELASLASGGTECCICKDQYSASGANPFGFYAFVSEGMVASHFIGVHQRCHSSCKLDRHARQTEWGAAAMRNCERPCNGIFPLPATGGDMSLAQYRTSLMKYYGNFGKGDALQVIVGDITRRLEMVSEGRCIAYEAGGGSLPNDILIIPFLILAGQALIDGDPKPDARRRFNMRMKGSTKREFLAYSLLSMTRSEWLSNRVHVLKQILDAGLPHPYRQWLLANAVLLQTLTADDSSEAPVEVPEKMKEPSAAPHGEKLIERVTKSSEKILKEMNPIVEENNKFMKVDTIEELYSLVKPELTEKEQEILKQN